MRDIISRGLKGICKYADYHTNKPCQNDEFHDIFGKNNLNLIPVNQFYN
jgi:hypothetical protein